MAIHRLHNLLCFASFLVAAPAAGAQEAKIPAGYKLVWSDEFDRAGMPEPGKWVDDTEANKSGWYNNEKQYYAAERPENAQVNNGNLVITARKERLTSVPDDGGQNYTSARLVTRGKAAWTYGHFAIRARLPCGKGTWPAFWMLGPDEIPWPENGEIDIMEQVGSAPDKIKGTIHTKATAGTFGVGSEIIVSDACRSFHVYSMTWTPAEISIGVDGRSFFTYKNSQEGSSSWPFDTPHFLLLNLAIGGDMAGEIDDTIFPVSMEIDYVRVYQKQLAQNE
jgi:beta-glucanase (GH16 family)